jgi:hypothetical protein
MSLDITENHFEGKSFYLNADLLFANEIKTIIYKPFINSATEQFSEVVSEKLKGELADIHALISSRDRKKIIKKIFKKDEKAYKDFFDLVNSTQTWDIATIIIEDLFAGREINPYSKEAIKLGHLVYLRYFSKDISHHNGKKLKFE